MTHAPEVRLHDLHWSLTFLHPVPHDTYLNEHCAQLKPLALTVAQPSIVMPVFDWLFITVVVLVVDPALLFVFVLPQFVVEPWLYVDEPVYDDPDDDDELPDDPDDDDADCTQLPLFNAYPS